MKKFKFYTIMQILNKIVKEEDLCYNLQVSTQTKCSINACDLN